MESGRDERDPSDGPTRGEKLKEFAHGKTPKKLQNPTDLQVRFRTGFVYVAY